VYIPGTFGRLVYLAKCCNGKGVYQHYGLELDPPRAKEVHEALRAAHLREWQRWLGGLTLEEQFGDLLEFLDGLKPRMVIPWEPAGDPWEVVVPPGVAADERALFSFNFRVLFLLLKARFG